MVLSAIIDKLIAALIEMKKSYDRLHSILDDIKLDVGSYKSWIQLFEDKHGRKTLSDVMIQEMKAFEQMLEDITKACVKMTNKHWTKKALKSWCKYESRFVSLHGHIARKWNNFFKDIFVNGRTQLVFRTTEAAVQDDVIRAEYPAPSRADELRNIAENFQGKQADAHKAWGNLRFEQAIDHLNAGNTDKYEKLKRLAELEFVSAELRTKADECNNKLDPNHADGRTLAAHNAWADYRYARMDVFLQDYRRNSYQPCKALADENGVKGDSELESARCLTKCLESPHLIYSLWADYHRARAEVYSLDGDHERRDNELKYARDDDERHMAQQVDRS